MRLAAGLMAGMAFMQMRLVGHLEAIGREGVLQFL
jgi:hypothetical protein